MTEQELNFRYDILFELEDVLSLSVEKIRIFNDILLDDFNRDASLEKDASEIQRLNACSVISHLPRLSMLGFEIMNNVFKLKKVYELLTAVIYDLRTDHVDSRCEELYQELFGGDSDD